MEFMIVAANNSSVSNLSLWWQKGNFNLKVQVEFINQLHMEGSENAKQLELYEAQLKQVEGALKLDPNNADLQNLLKDLKEVIDLQQQIVNTARKA
jgi:hypothetical protein